MAGIARWWRDLDGPSVVGCDYDGRLVEWCESNLPFMEAKTNASLPPLPFRDASFDLVYAISLLTHLPEDRQGPWLHDVRRILKPGGLFLFTVHGERWTPQLNEEDGATSKPTNSSSGAPSSAAWRPARRSIPRATCPSDCCRPPASSSSTGCPRIAAVRLRSRRWCCRTAISRAGPARARRRLLRRDRRLLQRATHLIERHDPAQDAISVDREQRAQAAEGLEPSTVSSGASSTTRVSPSSSSTIDPTPRWPWPLSKVLSTRSWRTMPR